MQTEIVTAIALVIQDMLLVQQDIFVNQQQQEPTLVNVPPDAQHVTDQLLQIVSHVLTGMHHVSTVVVKDVQVVNLI